MERARSLRNKRLKAKSPICIYGKRRGKQTSRERKKIDKSVEREPAAILLQVHGPQLLQRLFSQNQTSDDLWDLWQDHHVSDVQPFEKQKVHYEKTGVRNRPTEKAN